MCQFQAVCAMFSREECRGCQPRSSLAFAGDPPELVAEDRKSTRLNSSHVKISYAVFCLKKKKKTNNRPSPRIQTQFHRRTGRNVGQFGLRLQPCATPLSSGRPSRLEQNLAVAFWCSGCA